MLEQVINACADLSSFYEEMAKAVSEREIHNDFLVSIHHMVLVVIVSFLLFICPYV